MRTFVHHHDLIIDISHFTTHALDLVIDPCYFVVDTMSERQELCCCHLNFIVNFSNRLRASSISFFPSSFFRYFSGQWSVEDTRDVYDGNLTCSSLFDLLCRDGENI